MKLRFRVVLPAVYLIVALYLFGDLILTIGHGYGRAAWCNISLPASLLVPKRLDFLGCFVAGLVQYVLLGILLDIFLKSKRQ